MKNRYISILLSITLILSSVPLTAFAFSDKDTTTLAFDDNISETSKTSVVEAVTAMRNEATATLVNTVPILPDQVVGLMADGTQAGLFDVEWETVDASMFSSVGDIVIVNGMASASSSDNIPVTCSVRVTEGIKTVENVASNASSLTQDCTFISDTLEAINNGYKESVDNTSQRWTNWNNRMTSDTATLTFEWDTTQLIDAVNIQYYYDNCSAYPEAVLFQYTLDGVTWIPVDVEETTLLEAQSYGAEYEYKLSEVINPIAFRAVLTQQGGISGAHCVGIIEMELMSSSAYVELENSAELTCLISGGTEIENFDPSTILYTAFDEDIEALTESNVGITILPIYEDYVRIVTVSEDGTKSRTYVVYIGPEEDLENYTDVSGMYMWMHLYDYSDANGWALDGQNTILASWTPNSVSASHHQANTYEDAVTYTDDDGQIWYLIPVSILTKTYGNYGFDFDPSYCPILYTPNAYYTDAQDCLYADWYYRGDNATWYLRAAHTGDYGNVRLNLYYVPLTVVYDAVDPSGTTINLFDYWLTTQDASDSQLTDTASGLLDMGINQGHPFKFSKNPGASIADGSFNKWTGSAAPKTGIVRNVLFNAYPALTGDTTIGMTENDVESLNYLFDPNLTTAYRTAYTDVKGLLSMDDDGYYAYNSYQQQAWYNEATNNITRYEHPGTAASSGTANKTYGQFFPFQEPELAAVSNCESENINHYFGMTMTTHFIQSNGGYLTDEREQPSLFEFSGEDDVWIFIDNVLVADLGGIHDTTSVSIDFVTGGITVNKDTDYETASTLRAAFEAAIGAENLTQADWSGNTFADNTSHTIQFFYLERGNAASNLSLRFNMGAMSEDSPELPDLPERPEFPETGGPGVFATTAAGVACILTAAYFLMATNWEAYKRRQQGGGM